MHLFYSREILDQRLKILDKEHHHCSRVLRLNKKDEILATDGLGNFYTCEIEEIKKDSTICLIRQKKKSDEKELLNVDLAIAPTKNIERFEWCVEKCTEIGIRSITPIWCERSERKTIRTDRIENIIVAAAKQSLKARFTSFNSPVTHSEYAHQCRNNQKYIAHCLDDSSKPFLGNRVDLGSDISVMIGPEGDFSEEEIKLANKAGFQAVSLGANRLRTETAGVYACAVIHAVNEIRNEHNRDFQG